MALVTAAGGQLGIRAIAGTGREAASAAILAIVLAVVGLPVAVAIDLARRRRAERATRVSPAVPWPQSRAGS